MSIPNATPEQLASQRRIRRRAARILDELADRKQPFPLVDAVLVQRPVVAEIRGAGVVVRENLRWSA